MNTACNRPSSGLTLPASVALLCAVGFASGALNTPSAKALLPDFYVEGHGGYGQSDDEPNPYGTGFGGRAGVTLLGMYLGGAATYYLGDTGTPSGLDIAIEQKILQLGGEFGYELGLGPVAVRGYLGAGLVQSEATTTPSTEAGMAAEEVAMAELEMGAPGASAVTSTADAYFVAPGVNGLFAFDLMPGGLLEMFVGLDVSYNLIFGLDFDDVELETSNGMSVLGRLGLRI